MPLSDALPVALRALSFVAVFQAAGVALFLSFVGDGAAGSRAGIVRLGAWSAGAGMAATAAHHLLEPARLTGGFAGLLDPAWHAVMLGTDAGAARILRIGGLALILWALARPSRRAEAAGIVGAALVAISFAFMGHTAGSDQRWLLATVLFVHLIVVAFWFGSLLPLYAIAGRESPSTCGTLTARYSSVAVRLVPSIFVAGLVLSLVLIPSFAAIASPYGFIVVGKAAAFGALMLLAAANKWRWGPRIASGDAAALRGLRRFILIEWCLIAAVLAATAVMTALFSPER